MTLKQTRPLTAPPRRAVPRCGTVEIVGPDGVGKSTLLAALVAGPFADVPVLHLHHRPRVLPGRASAEGPVTEPHAQRPYPLPLSWLKLGYLLADHWLGGWLRVRPAARRGWVVLERSWWDIAVDQRRYRLQGCASAARLLGRLLPPSQLVLVLEAPPEVVLARKSELTRAELEDQARRWHAVLPRSVRRLHLDASLPAEEVCRQAAEALAGLAGSPRRDPGWTSLPSRRRQRWVLPRGPRRVAHAGLLVHHPITRAGLLQWWLARGFARLGGFRLLPRTDRLPAELVKQLDELETRTPFVAVARGNRPDRSVALLVDAHAQPVAVAKVARSTTGAARLDREADLTERVGALLTGCLAAPRVLERRPGLLLLDAVDWRPRLRVERLPVDVAAALGRLARPTADAPAGWAHGDVAPWNLLRTRTGWVLIDWEDAGPRAPFFDLLHHLVQAHALLGRPRARALVRGVHGSGWIGRAVRAYAAGAGLAPETAAGRLAEQLRSSPGTLVPAARSAPAPESTTRKDRRDPDRRRALLSQRLAR